MTLFEFISVMISIVLGLSLAQMLSGLSRLARHSKQVTAYLPHTIWVINLLFLHFLLWWSFWDYRGTEWTYPRFLIIALEPLLIFLIASILVPAGVMGRGDSLDLRAYFHDARTWFFTAHIVLELLFVVDGPLVFDSEPWWIDYRVPQLAIVAVFAVALVDRREWAQQLAAWTVFALLVWSQAARFLPAAFE